MMLFKKQLGAAMSTVALCLGVLVAGAHSASAVTDGQGGYGVAPSASGVISGTVDCFYGNNNVSGVWVNVTNGVSGFATLSGSGSSKSYSYSLSQPSTYRLHVGCGKNPSDWGATMYSPLVNGQCYSWVCSYSLSAGYYCAVS